MKNVTFLIIFSSLFLLSIILPFDVYAATTYYIDATNGLDSNNGLSTSTAWQTLSKASASPVTSGDTILLKKGETWTGTTLTPAAGTTIDAYGSGAKPIIDGNSAVARSISITANNVSVSNITVYGATSSMVFNTGTGTTISDVDSTGTPIAFRINAGTATLNRVTSSNASTAAFYFENSSSTTINTASSTTTSTGSGFRAITSSTLTCNDCTVSGSAVDGFSISNSATLNCNRCKAYNNGSTGDSTSGDGYTSHDTSTLNIHSSIAYGNYKSGVAVTGASSGEILNSSFYNNVQSTNGSGWDSSGDVGIGINATGTWTIKNNITYAHPVEFMITAVAVAGGATVTSNYNLFYDSLGGSAFDYNGVFYNFSNYKTASGKDANSLNTNPLFRDISSSNFLLLPTSPAINAGASVGLTTDYVSSSVPQGSSPDIGAYEFLLASAPSALSQYKSDGATSITTGNMSDTATVVLKFTMSSSNSTDTLTPQIEVQPIGTDFTNSATNSGDVVSYSGSGVTGTVTVTGLTGGNYHWQARINNPAGSGSWTSYGGNAESATDFSVDSTAPSTPNNLTIATATDDNTPTLNWDASTDSESGLTSPAYTLQWSNDSNFITDVNSATSNTNSYTLTSSLKDANWYFRVKATDVVGNSSDYSTANTTIYTVKPGTPTFCATQTPSGINPWLYEANSNSRDSIVLRFISQQTQIDHFAIEYGIKSGDYKYSVLDISKDVTSYIVENLSANTAYFFRIRAGNGCATGNWSNEISAKTLSLLTTNNLDITSSKIDTIPNQTPKEESYEVDVKVVDTNNSPVVGAKVTIHSKVQETVTDENGLAIFTNIEPGDHKIIIAYNNFEGEQEVNLTGDVKKFSLDVQVKETTLAPFSNKTEKLTLLIMVGIIVLLATFKIQQNLKKVG